MYKSILSYTTSHLGRYEVRRHNLHSLLFKVQTTLSSHKVSCQRSAHHSCKRSHMTITWLSHDPKVCHMTTKWLWSCHMTITFTWPSHDCHTIELSHDYHLHMTITWLSHNWLCIELSNLWLMQNWWDLAQDGVAIYPGPSKVNESRGRHKLLCWLCAFGKFSAHCTSPCSKL